MAGRAPGGRRTTVGPAGTDWRAERRQAIVRAAFELLSNSEYEAVQMRDVAEAGGVALATLYRYFPSKEHLFGAVQVEWVERLRRRILQRPLRGDSDLERLLDVLDRSVRAFKRKPQFYRVLLMLESTKDPAVRQLYEVLAEATAAAYGEAIRDAHPDVVEDLLQATLDLLGAELRAWALGRRSLEAAGRHIERSLRLLFTYRDPAVGAAPPLVAARSS